MMAKPKDVKTMTQKELIRNVVALRANLKRLKYIIVDRDILIKNMKRHIKHISKKLNYLAEHPRTHAFSQIGEMDKRRRIK
jgi:hypothetical protein